jgi:hypothetical protein
MTAVCVHPFVQPAPIRKGACGAFPLLEQLTLLIDGRSLRTQSNCQIRASTICQLFVFTRPFSPRPFARAPVALSRC